MPRFYFQIIAIPCILLASATLESALAQRPLFSKQLVVALNLSEEQQKLRDQLRNQAVGSDTHPETYYNDIFINSLSRKQRQIYRQFVTFSLSGGLHNVDAIRNAPFKSELNLTPKQTKSLERMKTELEKSLAKLAEQSKSVAKESDAELGKKLESFLLPHQRKLYRGHIGKEFDFSKTSFASKIAKAQSLSVADVRKTTFSSTSFSAFYLLMATSGRIDAPIRYAALLTLAVDKHVAEDVAISESQLEKLEKLKADLDKILEDFANAKFLLTGKVDKNAKTDGGGDLREEVLRFDEKKKIKEMNSILGSKKFNRLIQVYRQLSVTSGSKGNHPLFNPGWIKFLELTDDQISQFKNLKRSTIEKSAKNRKEMRKKIVDAHMESYRNALNLLSADQRQIIKSQYGKFANVASGSLN
jgi:hypothetical protein